MSVCPICRERCPSSARFCAACGTRLSADSVSARSVEGSLAPGGRAELIQIGEVAVRVGLSLRTVRYYEEMGLLRPTARTQGGFRLYSEGDVKRLFLLKGVKPAGFTLEEIRELMALFDSSSGLATLDEQALRELVVGLGHYDELAERGVDRLERHLVEVRKLHTRIGERRAQCLAALEAVSVAEAKLQEIARDGDAGPE